MGKEVFLNRYSLIIKRLEKSSANYAQIESYLMESTEFQDNETLTYSIRTLQRDIKDIEKLFSIEIKNERIGDKRYYIANRPEQDGNEHSQILLESYQIINAINQYPDFANYVFAETRQPKGIQHFSSLLYAIQNRRIILFDHYKFVKTEFTQRRVFPLGLKESKNRWYLIAIDSKDEKLKTFGLDRMDHIETLKNTYKKKEQVDIKNYFKDAFGIITGAQKEDIQEIIIKATKEQADYIKSFPLHHSQCITEVTATHIFFKISVFITYDFIQEILSFGKSVEVIAPQKLRAKVTEILTDALAIYKS
jgi:proteasome accessory factor B